jgi:hypothetical protein
LLPPLRASAVAVLFVIQQGSAVALAFASSPPTATHQRVPYPSRTCHGWDDKCSLRHDAIVVVFAFLLPTAKTVISTEAAPVSS